MVAEVYDRVHLYAEGESEHSMSSRWRRKPALDRAFQLQSPIRLNHRIFLLNNIQPDS